MRIFDLHCDTLTKCLKQSEGLQHASGHLSLSRGKAFDAWAQVFAVFVPDTMQGLAAAEYCSQTIDFFHAQLDDITQVCKPILAIENANALAGSLQKLEDFAAKQVRIITITWNGENELGHGAACDSALGLKSFGKQAIQRMFKLGIHPDVSHLNTTGFWDVAKLSLQASKPLLATHSGCAAIQPHRRNLTDDQLQAIFSSNGLVGLCLYEDFLGNGGTSHAVARHLAHIIRLGGENHVALGSDFDGCSIHPTLAGIEKLPILNENLARLGFCKRTREKFFWRNAAQFFSLP